MQCSQDSLHGYQGYSENILFLCGPIDKLKIKSNYNTFPNTLTTLTINSNSGPENKTKVDAVVNDMWIHKAQVYKQSDLKSMKVNPVDSIIRYFGKY